MGRWNVVKMRLSRVVILAVVLCVPAAGWAAFEERKQAGAIEKVEIVRSGAWGEVDERRRQVQE